jgi:hypothetical protein
MPIIIYICAPDLLGNKFLILDSCVSLKIRKIEKKSFFGQLTFIEKVMLV